MAWHIVIPNYYHLSSLHNSYPEEVGIRHHIHIFMAYFIKTGQQQKVISEGQGCMFNKQEKGLIASVAKATHSMNGEQSEQDPCGSHISASETVIPGTSNRPRNRLSENYLHKVIYDRKM